MSDKKITGWNKYSIMYGNLTEKQTDICYCNCKKCGQKWQYEFEHYGFLTGNMTRQEFDYCSECSIIGTEDDKVIDKP